VKLAKQWARRKIIGAKGSTILPQRNIFTTTSKLTSIEESSKFRLNPIACASEEKFLVTAKSVHGDDKRWSERIHLRVADDGVVEARLREKQGMPPL
jgi:ribosomal protein S10